MKYAAIAKNKNLNSTYKSYIFRGQGIQKGSVEDHSFKSTTTSLNVAKEVLQFNLLSSNNLVQVNYVNTNTNIIDSAHSNIYHYAVDIDLNFDNNTNEFENKHYLKNLTTSYKLTTGYLTDAQAKLMPNLIETTKAYLCELDTKNYIPVLINNNSVDIKTYRNQGRKLFTYTIDVQESQNKFIK